MEIDLWLSRTLQGEAHIKNAHLIQSILIHDFQLLLYSSDTLYIYSLKMMAENRASLTQIIPLQSFFPFPSVNPLEGFFSAPVRGTFPKKVFGNQLQLNENVLLKASTLRSRILSLGGVRVKKLQVSKVGTMLIILEDGRCCIAENEGGNNLSYTGGECEKYSKEIIVEGTIGADESIVLLKREQIEVTWKGKVVVEKVKMRYPNGTVIGDGRRVVVWEGQKVWQGKFETMKLENKYQTAFQQFVERVEIKGAEIFALVVSGVYRINSIGECAVWIKFQNPLNILTLDSFGNYICVRVKSDYQHLSKVAKTKNGVFVGLAVGFNNNFKDGRIIVFQPNWKYYLKLLCQSVKIKQVAIQDCVFLVPNKQLIEKFNMILEAVDREQSILVENYKLDNRQIMSLAINLEYICFKKINKTKVLVNRIKESLFGKNEVLLYCCFSQKEFGKEAVRICKKCQLYGLASEGIFCPVCYDIMLNI